MSSLILFPTNEYTTSSKSSEEIQRLMLPETNSVFDNLQYILNKGHPLQQPYAYRNFHHFPRQLLSTVCSRLSKEDYENQVLIGESLKLLMRKTKGEEKEFSPPKNAKIQSASQKYHYAQKSDKIIQDKFSYKNKGKPEYQNGQDNSQELVLDSEQIDLIFDSALEALSNWSSINNQHLVQIVENAVQIKPRARIVQGSQNIGSRQGLLKTLEQTILSMGKVGQPIISKIVSGRLIPIFIKYTGQVIRGEMIDIIKRVITDSEFEAKKIWLEEILPKLLERLKPQYIELHLQQKIYETIYDQNEQIGCMALSVVLNNVNRFSVEEQSSRIVKLFIDSLTSKSERIVMMVTGIMGQIYQKLQYIILKNQGNCLKFWKSFIEVAESKNEKILNNFIYSLPGILLLSKKYHRVEAICQIYIELFFNPDADVCLLARQFHEMVKMFPGKRKALRQTAYTLLAEVFSSTPQSSQSSDETIKILDCLFANLLESKQAFLEDSEVEKEEPLDLEKQEQNSDNKNTSNQPLDSAFQLKQFDQQFLEYLQKYTALCLNKKNGSNILNLYESILKCSDYFPTSYTEQVLLPKLYHAVRAKAPYTEKVMTIIVVLLINNYASKINVELSKSSKSYEREAALLFFYYCHSHFSIDLFQEFKMGEKYLQFSTEKSMKNKLLFIKNLPEVMYYFTREEKIELTIIINKLKKEQISTQNGKGQIEVQKLLNCTDFLESETKRQELHKKSKKLRQREKNISKSTAPNIYNHLAITSKKALYPIRRGTTTSNLMSNNDLGFKDLRKEDILKKRLENNSKTKIMPKDRKEGVMTNSSTSSKRKTPGIGNRININKKN